MAKTRRAYTGGAASTTTSSVIAASGTTSFTITAYTGWPYGSDPFFVVVEPGTANEEKILVTRTGSTDTTINVYATPSVAANRGADGTSSVAHSSGVTVFPVFTALDADEANELTSAFGSKGDLVSYGSSTFETLGVGTNDEVLIADSGEASGLKWGSVDTAQLAALAVTGPKLANATVETKTASYTLVAGDRNKRIVMNNAGATTITVNDSVFSAGDVVWIHNIGAGTCTVTAGTATVNTAASLDLAQWEGGSLYFTSASSAIFFRGGGAASTDVVVEYLVIAGGGGTAGVNNGRLSGGGGAGGYINSYSSETSGGGSTTASKFNAVLGTSYTVTVGGGGAGSPNGSNPGSRGSNSAFGSVAALGGGGAPFYGNLATGNALRTIDGGSGAGESRYNDSEGDALFDTQGYDGGSSTGNLSGSGTGTAGGGGGAGEAGNTDGQGSGGDGLSSSITGSAVVRGGGGSGSTWTSGADIPGGDGGGGDGRDGGATTTGDNGDANTGGGGGGGVALASQNTVGSNGGSGVVIIRFLTSAGSPTIGAGLTSSSSTDGDYTVIEFTAGSDTVSWS